MAGILHYAVGRGNTACVRLLLAVPGININKVDEYG